MTITEAFTTAGTISFQLDKAATLRTLEVLSVSGCGVLLTTNPSRLMTDLTASSQTVQIFDVIAAAVGTAQVPTVIVGGLAEKLRADTTYFLVADTACAVILVFS